MGWNLRVVVVGAEDGSIVDIDARNNDGETTIKNVNNGRKIFCFEFVVRGNWESDNVQQKRENSRKFGKENTKDQKIRVSHWKKKKNKKE